MTETKNYKTGRIMKTTNDFLIIYDSDGKNFRVTFDKNINFEEDKVNKLTEEIYKLALQCTKSKF